MMTEQINTRDQTNGRSRLSAERHRAPARVEVDVVVVGAGAAGVGVGVALSDAGISDFLILDRYGVGASFDRWPEQMRFITPSFATNSIGMLDLNSVVIGASPAFTLGVEHPTGTQYAAFLRAVAEYFELPVRPGIDVLSVTPGGNGFVLHTDQGAIWARQVIWAAGEFQYPQTAGFPGAELCRHNATIDSWESVAGRKVVVIGGYESGIDAAIHLARIGMQVTVLDRGDPPPWVSQSSDPSTSLSTHTRERLGEPQVKQRVTLVGGAQVTEAQRRGRGYRVLCDNGDRFNATAQPILATGFGGSVSLVADLFDKREDGYPLLNDRDESTTTPGLFLCGPMVRHDNHVFCFIYKFRQRFAVVAKTIADRLGLPAEELETYRQWGMYLDDLSCCGEECVC